MSLLKQLGRSEDQVLRATPTELAYHISDLAKHFALCGYPTEAISLVSKLNQYSRTFRKKASTILTPLQLLWQELGEWPDGEKEILAERIVGEKNGKKRGNHIGDKEIQEYLADRAKNYAECWNLREALGPEDVFARGRNPIVYGSPKLTWREYTGPTDNSSATEKQTAIRKLIKSFDEADIRNLSCNEIINALTTALDMRLALESTKDPELDELSSGEIIRRIAKTVENEKDYLNTWTLSSLTESPRAWGVFKDGALARALSMDDIEAREYISVIRGAIDERMRSGRIQLPEAQMKETLEDVSHNATKSPRVVAWYEEMDWAPPETLLFNPAPEEEIHATEKRLGVELPEDYKNFLRISNGFKVPSVVFDPPLYEAGKIRWLNKQDDPWIEEQFLDIPPEEIFQDIIYRTKEGTSDKSKWTFLKHAIEIGKSDIYNVLLLPPDRIDETRTKMDVLLKSPDYSDDVKTSVRHSVESFAGGIEAYYQLRWTCILDGGSHKEVFPSFGAYLQALVEKLVRGIA